MPIEVTCPSCRRLLQVPDELIEHSVKCPECGLEWNAAAPPNNPSAESAPPGEPHQQAHPTTPAVAVRETIAAPIPRPPAEEHIRECQAVPGTPVSGPPPSGNDDLDEDYEEDDEEFERDLEERLQRRATSRGVKSAKQRLLGPAIGILVGAGLSLLDALFQLTTGAFGMYRATAMRGPSSFFLTFQGIQLIYCVWLAASAATMLFGSLQMLKVRRFGWSFAACIAAIIPNCECCFLISLPFGIWGLVVLLQPDVKQAFRYRPPVDDRPRELPQDDIAAN
jgi:hypothetical protein